MVRSVLGALKQVFKGSHIVLRTASWGHTGCPGYHAPFTNITKALEAAADNPWQCVSLLLTVLVLLPSLHRAETFCLSFAQASPVPEPDSSRCMPHLPAP